MPPKFLANAVPDRPFAAHPMPDSAQERWNVDSVARHHLSLSTRSGPDVSLALLSYGDAAGVAVGEGTPPVVTTVFVARYSITMAGRTRVAGRCAEADTRKDDQRH